MKHVFAIFCSLFFSSQALADCLGFLSPEDHVSQSDAVFLGIARKTVSLEAPVGWGGGPDHATDFEVVEILKGEASAKFISVLHHLKARDDYGLTFKVGEQYEVFASLMDDGRLVTGACLSEPGYRQFKRWSWDDYRKAAKKL